MSCLLANDLAVFVFCTLNEGDRDGAEESARIAKVGPTKQSSIEKNV
jgi:hypothetical protein